MKKHWAEEVDVNELHEPTVRAIIDTMRRTGAKGAAYVLERQYANDQVESLANPESTRLRQLADFVESNPTIDLPISGKSQYDYMPIHVSSNRWEGHDLINIDPKKELTRIRRAIGGKWDKDYSGASFELKGKLGDTFVKIWASRENVCEKVVVGTEIKEVPDYANIPKVTREVEIVEWKCPESMLV